MTHSLTRKMSDTFSENDKGFENTTETSHARYQHHLLKTAALSCFFFISTYPFFFDIAEHEILDLPFGFCVRRSSVTQ